MRRATTGMFGVFPLTVKYATGQVGDQSDFVNAFSRVLSDVGQRLGGSLDPLHFRYFCDKLAASFCPRYYEYIFRWVPNMIFTKSDSQNTSSGGYLTWNAQNPIHKTHLQVNTRHGIHRIEVDTQNGVGVLKRGRQVEQSVFRWGPKRCLSGVVVLNPGPAL
jgi:hypothetical protein